MLNWIWSPATTEDIEWVLRINNKLKQIVYRHLIVVALLECFWILANVNGKSVEYECRCQPNGDQEQCGAAIFLVEQLHEWTATSVYVLNHRRYHGRWATHASSTNTWQFQFSQCIAATRTIRFVDLLWMNNLNFIRSVREDVHRQLTWYVANASTSFPLAKRYRGDSGSQHNRIVLIIGMIVISSK